MNNVGAAGISVGVYMSGLAHSVAMRPAQTGTPSTFWSNPTVRRLPPPLPSDFVLIEEAGGPTTHFGETSLAATVTVTTVGTIAAFGATSLPITVAAATAGTRTTSGATSLTLTVSRDTVGKLTALGRLSLVETVAVTTAGTVQGVAGAPQRALLGVGT